MSFVKRTSNLLVETSKEKMSISKTSEDKIVKSKSRTSTQDDKSLSVETLGIRRMQRPSEGVRVVFADEASEISIEQNDNSDATLAKTPAMSEELFQSNLLLDINDEDSYHDGIEKTATHYSRTIEKISGIEVGHEVDSYETIKIIEERAKLATKNEIYGQPNGSPKVHKTFEYNKHESARHSSEYLSSTIAGMLTEYPHKPQLRLHLPNEADTGMTRTIESSTSETPTGNIRFSENVGVLSMLFDTPQTDRLPHLEAKAFAVVLQEALDFLEILEHVIPARVDERWDDSYKTIDELYGRPEEPKIMFREDMGLLPLIPEVSAKIQRHRTYIYDVLKGTLRDILCERRYDRLETEVDDTVRTLEGEHNLEVNNEIWTGQIKQLQELIESDRVKNEQDAKNFLAKARRINVEVDNCRIVNSYNLAYVERWEEARLEQQKLRLELQEQELSDALGDCHNLETVEQIVSGEVRIFMQANMRDLEDEMIAWTSRYNEEIEQVQQEIKNMKEKVEQQKLDLQKLYELQEERQIFLDQCYMEKEQAEREAEQWNRVNNAATMIQSLWRGYMVRHRLGQYKKLFAALKKKNKKKNVKKNKK